MHKHDYNYIQSGKASVLIDGQFGSTGKGLLAAYLAAQPQNEVNIATTNASANAGHWTKSENVADWNFCCFHLPTFGVIQPDSMIYINAGAIINPTLLFEEIDSCNVDPERIMIHPNATVIEQKDIDAEMRESSKATEISSTRKGVGMALARKIMRTADVAKDCPQLEPFIKQINLNQTLMMGAKVSVEVPQGYSLSLNGPFYPYTTSRNCTVAQGLSDASIHPSFLGKVAMSVRTYPIRVGSIPHLGYSGDVYDDQEEITFEDLGVEEELTTVTKRVRRIFTWSYSQYCDAISENRPALTFLNFCNYGDNWREIIDQIKHASDDVLAYNQEILTGWGPNVEDVRPLDDRTMDEYDA